MCIRDSTNGELCGLIGIHVDDLLVTGKGTTFDSRMKELESKLPFGNRKYGTFTYCGLRHIQHADSSITVDQEEYCEQLQPMANKHIKDTEVHSPADHTNFKSLVGGLAWPVINTRPDAAFDVSWLASKGENATGADIRFGNKLQRKLKAEKVQLRYTKTCKSIYDWTIVTFHDAGWATRPSLHSQAVAAVFLADRSVLEGKIGKATLIG